jgi:NADH:ubiquinone oxidoreductase subunit E
MVVRSRSPRVLEARRATIELLLTGHTGTCVTDAEARECTLHKLASDLEVGPPRFHVKRPRLYAVEEGPYVRRDMSRCILCRKCIRACEEVVGQSIYGMAYRGFDSKVVVDWDIPLNKEVCKDCGVCIEYCPTSALMWPEGVKKRDGGTKKKAAPATPGNGHSTRLLDLLKSRLRTEGSLSPESFSEISRDLDLPLSEVYGVATFYSFLSTKPRGRHVIRICKSLPCYLKNGLGVIEAVSRAIGIGVGETTPDGRFSFELTNCVGACDKAPAMLVDDTVYGNLTPDTIVDILKSYGGK